MRAAVRTRPAVSQALVDQDDLEVLVGKHLWLHSSRRCACQSRPTGGLGTHYAWYIEHLAAVLVSEGFGRVRI